MYQTINQLSLYPIS